MPCTRPPGDSPLFQWMIRTTRRDTSHDAPCDVRVGCPSSRALRLLPSRQEGTDPECVIIPLLVNKYFNRIRLVDLNLDLHRHLHRQRHRHWALNSVTCPGTLRPCLTLGPTIPLQNQSHDFSMPARQHAPKSNRIETALTTRGGCVCL